MPLTKEKHIDILMAKSGSCRLRRTLLGNMANTSHTTLLQKQEPKLGEMTCVYLQRNDNRVVDVL